MVSRRCYAVAECVDAVDPVFLMNAAEFTRVESDGGMEEVLQDSISHGQ